MMFFFKKKKKNFNEQKKNIQWFFIWLSIHTFLIDFFIYVIVCIHPFSFWAKTSRSYKYLEHFFPLMTIIIVGRLVGRLVYFFSNFKIWKIIFKDAVHHHHHHHHLAIWYSDNLKEKKWKENCFIQTIHSFIQFNSVDCYCCWVSYSNLIF